MSGLSIIPAVCRVGLLIGKLIKYITNLLITNIELCL
jgi:hypothetical protein